MKEEKKAIQLFYDPEVPPNLAIAATGTAYGPVVTHKV
jgi:hypothetical protein